MEECQHAVRWHPAVRYCQHHRQIIWTSDEWHLGPVTWTSTERKQRSCNNFFLTFSSVKKAETGFSFLRIEQTQTSSEIHRRMWATVEVHHSPCSLQMLPSTVSTPATRWNGSGLPTVRNLFLWLISDSWCWARAVPDYSSRAGMRGGGGKWTDQQPEEKTVFTGRLWIRQSGEGWKTHAWAAFLKSVQAGKNYPRSEV